jgi:predicted ATP-grasp superfamily ATP-dependent carboligase
MQMKTAGAVITGGDFMALGVIRSLGRKGIRVHVLDHELSIGRFSRYCRSYTVAPTPRQEKEYLSFLIDFARKLEPGKWVLYANTDRVVGLLSKHRRILEEYYHIPTPDWEVIKYVYNKKNAYRLAESLGIPAPRTYYPQDRGDLEKLGISFPVIIKPATRDDFFDLFYKKAFLVRDKPHLLQTYQKVCDLMDPSEILIQEFIPGGPKHLYSFCPFFKEGKVVARIMARRSRQHPMDFGHATTFAETVYIPELEDMGKKFLEKIHYYGLAEVEFMFDTRDQKYKFLEVNARVWGWHTLAIGAGIDLPYLLYQDVIGQPVKLPSSCNDVKWIRMITDIPMVMSEMMKGRISPKDYLSSLRGKREYAVFSLDDPLPFFAEIPMISYRWLKRNFRL